MHRGPAEVAGDHHPLAVPAVDEHAGHGPEEEAGDDAGRHDEARSAPARRRPPMVAASRMMAEKPSQSPVADTTWTSHSRKNSWEPKSRTCQPGRSATDSA